MDEKRLEEVRERVESVTTETRGCRHCALGLHDRAFLLNALDEIAGAVGADSADDILDDWRCQKTTLLSMRAYLRSAKDVVEEEDLGALAASATMRAERAEEALADATLRAERAEAALNEIARVDG